MTSLPTALATGRRALLTSGLAGGAVAAAGVTRQPLPPVTTRPPRTPSSRSCAAGTDTS